MPSRFFAVRFSSYQSECLVASLLLVNGAGAAVVGSSVRFFAFAVDEAVTAAFLRRLLMRRPSSSSDDVKPESESEAGGGVAGFLRKLPLPLERFLKATWGISATVSSAMISKEKSSGGEIYVSKNLQVLQIESRMLSKMTKLMQT